MRHIPSPRIQDRFKEMTNRLWMVGLALLMALASPLPPAKTALAAPLAEYQSGLSQAGPDHQYSAAPVPSGWADGGQPAQFQSLLTWSGCVFTSPRSPSSVPAQPKKASPAGQACLAYRLFIR